MVSKNTRPVRPQKLPISLLLLLAAIAGLFIAGFLLIRPAGSVVQSTPLPSVEPTIQPPWLRAIESDVKYQPPGKSEKIIERNSHQRIETGDHVNVYDLGEALLSFADFLQVKVYRDTDLGIVTEGKVDPYISGEVGYSLIGTTYVLESLPEKALRHIRIKTPNGVEIGTIGTEFLAHYSPTIQTTWVVVSQGVVSVSSAGTTVTVPAAFQTWAEAGRPPLPPIPAIRDIISSRFPLVDDLTLNRSGAKTPDSELLRVEPCTVISATTIYEQPDIQTITAVSLPALSRFIAVARVSNSEWLFGFKPQTLDSGWVQRQYLDCQYNIESLATDVAVIERTLGLNRIPRVVRTPTPTPTETFVPTVISTITPISLPSPTSTSTDIPVVKPLAKTTYKLFLPIVMRTTVRVRPIATTPIPPSTVVPRAYKYRPILGDYMMWYDIGSFSNTFMWDIPADGPYNSGDVNTIKRQIQQAQQACLDGFAAHWVGPQEPVTTGNFNKLLQASSGTSLRHVISIQTNVYPGANVQSIELSIIDAIKYVMANWMNGPNYLKIDGRPVIVFTDMKRPWDDEQASLAGWSRIRAATDPNRTMIWMAEGLTTLYNPLFDGLYVYRIDHRDYPNSWAKQPRYAADLRKKEAQSSVKLYFADSIAPGFDNIRSTNVPNVRIPTAPFARDRQNGQYYRNTYEPTARTNADFMFVKSFNEWVEGTEIEPGRSYSDLYLNLTCEFARDYRR